MEGLATQARKYIHDWKNISKLFPEDLLHHLDAAESYLSSDSVFVNLKQDILATAKRLEEINLGLIKDWQMIVCLPWQRRNFWDFVHGISGTVQKLRERVNSLS